MDGRNGDMFDGLFLAFRALRLLVIVLAGCAIFAECRAWWRMRG
jgi:hypothetical protein